MSKYLDKLKGTDVVACLDALKEADDAVETINKDMFSIIGDLADDILTENANPSDVLKDVLKQFEQEYKKDRSLKHMPGSYRSAKSVIVNAVRLGINLAHDDHSIKGKSVLEKEINQAKKSNVQPVKGKDASLESSIMEARNIIEKSKGEVVSHLNLADQIASLNSVIEEIRHDHGV